MAINGFGGNSGTWSNTFAATLEKAAANGWRTLERIVEAVTNSP